MTDLVPRPTIDQEAVTAHLHAVHRRPTPDAVRTALADVPVLLAEVRRLAQLLTRTCFDFADLLAAARAALGADRDGEPDPLGYLRDQVDAHEPMAGVR